MSEIIEDTKTIFKLIRRDKSQAELLVRKFEDEKAWEPYRKERRAQFCLLYLIRIIEEFVHGDENREIVWLGFNLLGGFDDIKSIKKRYNAYASKALETKSNERIKVWEDTYGSLKDIENDLIEGLIDTLERTAKKDKQGKMCLGFAEKIIKELPKDFPNGIPEKVPLPTPRCLKMQADINDKLMPTPNGPKVAEESSDKLGNIFLRLTRIIKQLLKGKEKIIIDARIVLAVVIISCCLCIYLSPRMAGNEEEAAPLISDILVITPEIQLYPGEEGMIQLDVAPDGADIDSVNCIPDDPVVVTVDHRIVTAQAEWQEENHETQITVYGGMSPKRQVHVTVLPDLREQFTGADRPDGKPKGNEGKEDEQ